VFLPLRRRTPLPAALPLGHPRRRSSRRKILIHCIVSRSPWCSRRSRLKFGRRGLQRNEFIGSGGVINLLIDGLGCRVCRPSIFRMSSCFEATRIWRRSEPASLEKPSIRWTQERNFAVDAQHLRCLFPRTRCHGVRDSGGPFARVLTTAGSGLHSPPFVTLWLAAH
jgi:hypothetical protein